MEYVFGIVAIAVVASITFIAPWKMGLFKRPPPVTNYYIIKYYETPPSAPTARMTRNSTKRLVSNRPRMHARMAAREAQALTDEALAKTLEEWQSDL